MDSSTSHNVSTSKKKNGKVHTTQHLLYTAWPDKSVPRDVMSLLKLRNLMHLLFEESQNETDGVISQSDKEITNDIYEKIKQFIVVHCRYLYQFPFLGQHSITKKRLSMNDMLNETNIMLISVRE